MTTASVFWRPLTYDPRMAEWGTAIIGFGVALSCLFGHWFGGWLPHLEHLAFLAVPLGLAGVTLNTSHAIAIVSRNPRVRQGFAGVNMVTLSILGSALAGARGLDAPGTLAFPAGALMQLWIICALEIRRLDAQ